MDRGSARTPTWTELVGSSKWDGLLDPLDPSLRNLILLSGDLTQATYDAFNSDEHSKYCGSSRYGKRNFFTKVSFSYAAANYSVSEFLYATSEIDLPVNFLLFSLSRESWSKESNWIGYIAVSSDASAAASGRREIFVAWRGTIRNLEWIDVLQPELVSIEPLLSSPNSGKDDDRKPKVMKGWYTIYTSADPNSPFTKTSARTQLLSKIKELVHLYKNESLSIVCVGHSLGASLAILSAFDLVENGLSKVDGKPEFPICAIVFGCPQLGNEAFKDRLESLPRLRVLHVKNEIDLIPRYPSGLLGFVNTGVELIIDNRKSPYLKDSKNPSDWHNLQGMLNTVAGWNGKDKDFEFKVKRSAGLVNKSSEYLKDEYLVPGSWWVEKNKGMVLGPDGEWQLAPPAEEDIPVPPGSSGQTVENLFAVNVGAGTGAAKGIAVPAKKRRSGFPFCGAVSCFRGVK